MLSLSFLSNRFRTSRVCLYVRVGEKKNICVEWTDCVQSREKEVRESKFLVYVRLCVFLYVSKALACKHRKKTFLKSHTTIKYQLCLQGV